MIRIKRGNIARKKRQKILHLANGCQGAHSKLFRIANQQVMKSLCYAYIGRKHKKRIFRKIWIARINAISRLYKSSYNQIIYKLKKANIILNRKILSQIGIFDISTFNLLIKK